MSHNRLLFCGGVHGVGKTTVCRDVCAACGVGYLSAGELIASADRRRANPEGEKRVQDISGNQNALAAGLAAAMSGDGFYLLDGHFVLRNKTGDPEEIPVQIFADMSPAAIFVVTDAPESILRRIRERDRTPDWDNDLVAEMQERELAHARAVASILKIGMPIIIKSGDANALRDNVRSFLDSCASR